MTETATPGPAGGLDGTLPPSGVADMRRLILLLVGLLGCWLPVLFFRDAIPRAAALQGVVPTPSPYLVPEHAFLLYLVVPVVVMSACALLLSPGLVAAMVLGRARSTNEWLAHGFAASIVIIGIATAVVQSFVAIDAMGFIAVIAACTILLWFVLVWRHALHSKRGHADAPVIDAVSPNSTKRAASRAIAWPLAGADARTTMAWLLLGPVLILVALLPKFLWENFNGDGAHAYEAARLLLRQPVPFWPPGAGEIGGFPGLTSALYAYPASWFIRLFGPLEASARLPYILYLVPLSSLLLLVIEHGRDWRPAHAERLVLWLSLLVYSMVVAFSATYSPYSADIALPATQDTLLVACFLGFALASLRRDWPWVALFAVLTFTSLPNGILMIGFWMLAMAIRQRWRDALESAIAIAGLIAFAFLVPFVLKLVGSPAPGGEYSGGGALVRFAFLQLTDVRRFLYLLVPCGIMPGIALFYWRRMDDIAKTFALVTWACFLFAYVQAYSPLHYYIPAMLLPLVVYWRLPVTAHRSRREITLAIAAAVVALVLALPGNATVFTDARPVGETMEIRVGDYAHSDPDAFRASTLIHELIPYDWEPEVPEAAFGGSPLVFHYYARHSPRTEPPNYVIQPADEAAPEGMEQAATDGEFTAWVRSDVVWSAHRGIRPPTPAGSPFVRVPRGLLFRTEPLPEGFLLISLPAIAERLGIDVEALARRLGVE